MVVRNRYEDDAKVTKINRREMLAGTVALLGQAQLPRVVSALQGGDIGSQTASLPVKPKNLLSSTFTVDVLRLRLASVSDWKPFPQFADRTAWERLPQDTTGNIVKRAEETLGTEWPVLPATVFLEFARNGNRSHYEALNFGRRGRLSTLVLAECIEGKGRFLDDIANGVWLVCEETFWGVPAHMSLQKAGVGLPDVTEPVVDLFAAQTSATLSWIHYLIAEELATVSPLIPDRIRIEAKRRVLNPAFERNDFWWMWKGNKGSGFRLNNWNPWINSNLLATNLLLENDAERRVQAITKVCKSVDAFLDDYSPDAACEEGPGYWGESAAAYYDVCALLLASVSGASNVLADPFVRKMMHYIADVHIAGRSSVNYGDASALAGAPGELAYLIGTATGDAELAAFGAFTMPPPGANGGRRRGDGPTGGLTNRSLPSLFKMDEARNAPKADALGRDSWYPSLCLMTAREKAGTSDGFYLALQAAPNQRSHGHNDSGSFIVFHDGEPVFVDAGTQQYTAQTFSKDRYKLWYMQSAYHNLPTVGGVMQATGEPKYRATEPKYSSDDAHASIRLNLATAYPEEAGIQRWIRTVELDRKTSGIRLSEQFALAKEVPVVLNFLTPRVPAVDKAGVVRLSVLSGAVKDVMLNYDPVQLTASFEKIELTDQGMRMTWGQLYRVQLTSHAVTSGNWVIGMV
jgi:Heparinase II/III-like protein